mmetsp:Transcript_37106/g.106857  ORF Transcript_37106/g.106857 Transcript_37106/m.106857 type:complete len:291 (+) Transcript_37106:5174-6046(+)
MRSRHHITKGGNRVRGRHRSFWNKDGSIDFKAFLFVQARKVPIKTILERPCLNQVHFVGIEPNEIPLFVQNIAAKSAKFIPTIPPVSIQSILRSADVFIRNIKLATAFNDSEERPNKRHNTFAGNKHWQPTLSLQASSAIEQYERLTKAELVQQWPSTAFKGKPYLTLLDCAALRWLDREKQLCSVLDTDNNLGNCIASARWIHRQVQEWFVKQAMTPIQATQKQAHLNRCKEQLKRAADWGLAKACIAPQQHRFQLQDADSQSFPAFRINAKGPQEAGGVKAHLQLYTF